jgi:heparosan-N-sulfate-glucuronate 5-epimerase
MKTSMTRSFPISQTRLAMFRHWAKMLRGNSYWHAEQGMGRYFEPGSLQGYFNDLSVKTRWEGLVDSQGLPLCQRQDGTPLHFPTTLFQKALGHWDSWLASGKQDREHYTRFIGLADWACNHQDEEGGWPIWPLLGLSYPSPYSAMTQGEGISILARAYMISLKDKYLQSALRAVVPLLRPVAEGGPARYSSEGWVLEEVPAEVPKTILNGWVYALYGLYDLSLVHDSPDVEQSLQQTLKCLALRLLKFDAGYWSYYDDRGHLASPFYHRLHIAQLTALSQTFPNFKEKFEDARQRFEGYAASGINQNRAVLVKAYQKIKDPPPAVLR